MNKPTIAALALCFVATTFAQAQEHQHAGQMQHEMGGMQGMESMSFAGIPHTREASGTAWQPDSTPMHAYHMTLADWTVMAHFNAFAPSFRSVKSPAPSTDPP